jgi:hypothetical protein
MLRSNLREKSWEKPGLAPFLHIRLVRVAELLFKCTGLPPREADGSRGRCAGNGPGVFIVPQADLVETTDYLTVPWKPVARQAVFFAMDERGSEFAGRIETEGAKAQDALMNALLIDFGADNLTIQEQ